MIILLILAKKSRKIEIKLFPQCSISHEKQSQSQIFCDYLQSLSPRILISRIALVSLVLYSFNIKTYKLFLRLVPTALGVLVLQSLDLKNYKIFSSIVLMALVVLVLQFLDINNCKVFLSVVLVFLVVLVLQSLNINNYKVFFSIVLVAVLVIVLQSFDIHNYNVFLAQSQWYFWSQSRSLSLLWGDQHTWLVSSLVIQDDSRCEFKSTGFQCQIAVAKTQYQFIQ